MTFPQTPLNILVELDIAGVWTDITSYVIKDSITINRGRSDEASQVETSQCSMTLNNRDGRFSPRNPTSPYYGILNRNTPIRVSLPDLVSDEERFNGEVSSWPQRWDKTGTDVYVPIECSGILRRLQVPVSSSSTGEEPPPPADPVGYKEYLVSTDPRAYWALDEGTTSTQASSDTPNNSGTFEPNETNKWKFGAGDLTDLLPAGLRILGRAGNGNVNDADSITSATLDFVFRTGGIENTSSAFIEYFTEFAGGSGWIVEYDESANQISITRAEEGANTVIDTATAPAAFGDGELHHFRLTLTEDGADVDCEVLIDGVSILSGTQTTDSVEGAYRVGFDYSPTDGSTAEAFDVGHVILWNTNGVGGDAPAVADILFALTGVETDPVTGQVMAETAGRRIERLCSTAGVSLETTGDLDQTELMGPQSTDKGFVDLLRESAEVDRGILYEPRDSLSLAYRTRRSLYDAAADVTLVYSDGVFAEVPEPVDDDQLTQNDVTVSRPEGSSTRVTLDSGPLSVQAPPDGVGTYAVSYELNAFSDDQLPSLASWLLNLGTIDKARYPSLTLNLARDVFTSDSNLTQAVASLDIGDSLEITDLPNWLPPDDVFLLAQGFTETFSQFEWTITINCVPGDRYQIPEFEAALPPEEGNERARFDARGSALLEAIDSDDTAFDVLPGETPWTSNDSEFPFDILVGGERMTVSDITAPGAAVAALVGVGATDTDNNASLTPGLPAGVATGDIVAILASIRNLSGAGTPPTFTNLNTGTGQISTTFSGATAVSVTTPTANRLVLLSVAVTRNGGSVAPAVPSVEGCGMTFELIEQQNMATSGTNRSALFVFRGMTASPTAGPIDIDFGHSCLSLAVAVDQSDANVDTSGTNGSGAIVQSDSLRTSPGTSLTIPFPVAMTTGNSGFSAFCHRASEAMTPRASWTELAEEQVDVSGGSTTDLGFNTQYRASTDTDGSASWTTDIVNAGIIVEIKGAAAAPGSVDLPANWTTLIEFDNVHLMAREYDGVWTMPTITFTGGVANATTLAQSAAFENVTLAGAVGSEGNENASAQDIAITDVAVELNPDGNSGIIIVAGWKQDDWTSVAPPTEVTGADPLGYTEIEELSSVTGDDAAQVWGYRVSQDAQFPAVGFEETTEFVVTGGASAPSKAVLAFLPATGSLQTFTVTRSVNSVVKSHEVGDEVRLFLTPTFGF